MSVPKLMGSPPEIDAAQAWDAFRDMTRRDQSLAPLTWLKIGGPAQMLIEPRTVEEAAAVVRTCHEQEVPLHLLGGGSNLLVRDEGVSGVVLWLHHEAFTEIEITGDRVRAGAGALLSRLVSQTVAVGLAGLESLVGIPGTVAGAIRGNAGGRLGDIGQFVKSVTTVTPKGEIVVRGEEELAFEYRHCNLSDLIVSAEFAVEHEDSEEIVRRMRKLWIMKKATQPMSFQSAGCIFKNPRGLSAGALIEQAGLKGTRIGQCEVSDRHANFIVTYEGAKSSDVLKLIDLIRARVHEAQGVHLELEIQVW